MIVDTFDEIKWICIKNNDKKGYLKGEIRLIRLFLFEDIYSSTCSFPPPSDDDLFDVFSSYPHNPVYTYEMYMDKNGKSYDKEDFELYFQPLIQRRKSIIKKIIKNKC